MQQPKHSWCLSFVLLLPIVYGWTSPAQSVLTRNDIKFYSVHHEREHKLTCLSAKEDDFLDVEFEKTSPETDDVISSVIDDGENDLSALLGTSKTLIDVSLDTGDPRWKETRIPFFRGTEYIDCKLAFMVDLEGQSYGIGVPFDDVVAIVVQEKDRESKVARVVTKNVDPDAYEDNEEYAELMEIFAGQVQEQLGEDFQLRKTPKVLTISGGLDEITKDWENRVVTKPFEVDELLEMSKEKDKNDVEKEVDSFYKFMREELGDEEFEKTMKGDEDDELETELKELMGFFDVPGVDGITEDDTSSIEDLLKRMEKDIEYGEISEAKEFIPNTENSALKLLGYTFRDSGKSYFLVKPLKPCESLASASISSVQ
jgi:hypothetical protein